MIRIVAISDSHNQHKKLIIPECDLLIHCGDWTSRGYKHEVEDFAKWLNKQTQCKEIVLTPGNHEKFFEEFLPESLSWFKRSLPPRAHLLIDSGVELFGIKFWCSAVTPAFFDWGWNRADNEKGGEYHIGHGKVKYYHPIKPHFDLIPEDTNILITHGPPLWNFRSNYFCRWNFKARSSWV